MTNMLIVEIIRTNLVITAGMYKTAAGKQSNRYYLILVFWENTERWNVI